MNQISGLDQSARSFAESDHCSDLSLFLLQLLSFLTHD